MSLQRTKFDFAVTPEEVLAHQEGARTFLTIKYDVNAQESAREMVRATGKLGWDWLDVGCRQGHFLKGLQESGVMGRMAGIDIVPSYIEDCQDQGLDCTLGDAHDLPYPDKSFDIVYTCHCLEHCRDPHRVAQEILRVSREFVAVVVPLETAAIANRDVGHYWYSMDPLDWANLFQHPDWRIFFLASESFELTMFIIPMEKIGLWHNRPMSLRSQ